jgi:hypothetical protein
VGGHHRARGSVSAPPLFRAEVSETLPAIAASRARFASPAISEMMAICHLFVGCRRKRTNGHLCEATQKEPGPHSENRVADAESAQVTLKPGNESRDVPAAAARIDKSVLTFGAPRRHRDREHLKFVATQACLLCGRTPSDPHHLRFAQPQALGLKVSDEFTAGRFAVVPSCGSMRFNGRTEFSGSPYRSDVSS